MVNLPPVSSTPKWRIISSPNARMTRASLGLLIVARASFICVDFVRLLDFCRSRSENRLPTPLRCMVDHDSRLLVGNPIAFGTELVEQTAIVFQQCAAGAELPCREAGPRVSSRESAYTGDTPKGSCIKAPGWPAGLPGDIIAPPSQP